MTSIGSIIDYLHSPALALAYLVSSILCRHASHSPRFFARGLHQRHVPLLLMFLMIVSYVAEAITYLSRTLLERRWWAPQHNIVHVMGSILFWGYLDLRLFETDSPHWYAYLASWLSGCLFEISLYRLAVVAPPDDERYCKVLLAIHASRIVFTATLVVNGIFLVSQSGAEKPADQERQPLLGDGSSPRMGMTYFTHHGSESCTQEDEEDKDKEMKELQRRRLEEQGWIGYLRSFGIFMPYIWPRNGLKGKLCVIFLIFHLIAERLLRVFGPRQLGIIIDRLTTGRSSGQLPWREILVWMFLKWADSDACLDSIKKFALAEVRIQSYTAICELAFRHVMSLSMDFHNNKDSGEVIKSVEQAGSMTKLMELVLLDICPIVIDTVIAMWYVTHLFDIYMALVAFSTGITYIWVGLTISAWARPHLRMYAKHSRAQSTAVYESVSSWQTVSYFNRTEYEQDRYGAAVQRSVDSRLSYLHRAYFGYGVQALVLTLGLLSCSFLATWGIIFGGKPIGNFVTFTAYWGTMMFPLQKMAWSYQNLTSTLIDAERLLQLLNTAPSVLESEDAPTLSVPAGKVEFRGVSFAYGPHKEVMKNINFEVEPGQTVALVGESGGGKSTLFNLLCRFFDPKEGTIAIDDQDLRSVTLSSLHDAVGVVPQDPALFNRSIYENLLYANPDATVDQVEEACRAAAIHDKIMSFSAGYNSKVGERGVKLSGGEKQRLAIARVLLKRPAIVLLDEATSAVDSSTEATIQEAFRNLGAGRTMFIIAHRLSTIANADLILVIVNGEIIEKGRHQELLEKKGKYFELWNSQTKMK